MPFLLVHITGLHSPSIHPNNNASSKRYETRHLEARATRKSSSSADHSRFRHSHQQTAPTQYLVHQHRRHAHLTVDKQNWLSCSLVDTRRWTTVESTRLGTGAGLWRRRGALGCLGCSLPLFACHGDACSYECGLDMPECYPS